MMNCPKCGKEISEQSTFCPECGAEIKKETTLNGAPVNAPNNNYIPPNRPTPMKQSGLGIAALVLGILGCTSIIGLVLGIVDIAINDKNKKHTCAIIGIVISAVFLIFGGILATTSSDTKPTTEITEEIITEEDIEEPPVDYSEPEEVQSDTSEVESEVAAESDVTKKYNVGELFTNDYINVSYLDCGEFTNVSEYFEPKEGNKVIYASFEFENVSDRDQVVSSYDFNCYADGYSCEGYFATEDSIFSDTLSSGRKIKGNIYFEVPKDATDIEFEFDTNFWTSENIVFVYSGE